MTDKPTPTDAELEALLLDKLPASKHYIRPVIEKMVAAMQAAIDKWGQPAQAAEPVAWLDPWTGTKVTTDYDAYGKHGIPLYTAPQPVAREQLTDEQTKALMQAHRTSMLMTCKARVPECGEFAAIAQDLDWLCESFGIKGGQHGTA